MDSLHEEIHKLLESTERNRRQFLTVETETCGIAVDRGSLELSLGDVAEARKEYEIAAHGVEVIERFLGEARDEMPEIQAKLEELRKSLESLRQEIAAFHR